ncbi:MAG: ABC transporter permease [Bacteroidetes bacterium]|nr:ABC transporter permease [Bacteroidota bacterium]MBT4968611.1 ABC transporter permease [Bacteroidota bacterium]
MNISFWFARKYFYSKKVRNVINLIARVSQIGITVGTMALVVVLSVFNGFEDVILSLYNSFDPSIRITPAEGKFFEVDSQRIEAIKQMDGVVYLTPVIEENALIKYKDNQTIATLKAINEEYFTHSGIDSMMIVGHAKLKTDKAYYSIPGSGVASKLGLSFFGFDEFLQIYYPQKGSPSSFVLNPNKAFRQKSIAMSGIFQVQQDFDEKFILIPLEFGQKLIGNTQYTSLDILLEDDDKMSSTKNKIADLLGPDYIVKDRFELHKWLYNIMKSEKLMVYLILSFILLIAGFNLIGSLLMLTLEKKKDMMILRSMGGEESLIRRIFFYEGLLLSITSAIGGIVLGLIFCFLQMKFGIIRISQGSTFILDAYPVSFRLMDFVWVFITVVILGFLSSYLPARAAWKNLSIKDLSK